MAPPRAAINNAAPQQSRQVRLARARHSLDDTGISIDSEEIPSELIGDYSAREVLRLHDVAEAAHGENTQDEEDEDDMDGEDEDEDEDGEEEEAEAETPTTPDPSTQLPPRGLKEISSLASWTVSTSKPGCGVSALRHPSSSLFWQSDGPQPHLLTIHFFKQVSISHMRIYLDFENDESYTPTRMQFLAGSGLHDLQEFADMSFVQPMGWIPVDFSSVGPVVEEEEDTEEDGVVDWGNRPELRCFLVQVRILENHQNGKDTHLRGLQLFARDERDDETARLEPDEDESGQYDIPTRFKEKRRRSSGQKLKKASWMMEPELR